MKLGPFADLWGSLPHLSPFFRQVVFVPQGTRHQDPARGACDNRSTAINEKDFFTNNEKPKLHYSQNNGKIK